MPNLDEKLIATERDIREGKRILEQLKEAPNNESLWSRIEELGLMGPLGERGNIDRAIEDCDLRLQVIENIVLRNPDQLKSSKLKIFVSARFAETSNDPLPWITWLEEPVSEKRKEQGLPEVEFVFGIKPGARIESAVIDRIISCHCFLSIFSHSDSSFLDHELGVAFGLAKPVILCADTNFGHIPSGLRGTGSKGQWFQMPDDMQGTLNLEAHSRETIKEEPWFLELADKIVEELNYIQSQLEECAAMRKLIAPLFSSYQGM